MNHYMSLQTPGKRLLAGFLDFVIAVLVSIFVYVPTIAITNKVELAEVTYQLERIIRLNGLYGADSRAITDETLYPEALYNFYVDKEIEGVLYRQWSPILVDGNTNNSAEDYYVVVLGKGSSETLFDFSVINIEKPWDVPALAGNEEAVKSFYKVEIEKAHKLLDAHPDVIKNYKRFEQLFFLAIAISYLIGGFLTLVIVPLFFKHRETLGKLITKSVVVNALGYKTTFLQGLVRNTAIFLFSYVLFFVPFHIGSFLFSMFSKSRKSLYDFLGATYVANKDTTIVFANEYAEQVYRKELAKRLIAVEKRKQNARQEDALNKEFINHKD